MKNCTKCKIEKDLSSFEKDKNQKSGLRPECRKCRSERAKLYYLSNKEKYDGRYKKYKIEDSYKLRTKNSAAKFKTTDKFKELEKKRYFKAAKKNFGIDEQQYNSIFAKQNGCCAVCKKHQTELDKRLAVDHCHKSGFVRGLLCTSCNVAIGNFKENINSLKEAIDYLIKYSGGISIVKNN